MTEWNPSSECHSVSSASSPISLMPIGVVQGSEAARSRSVAKSGPSNSATARSYFSMPHSQKSKSMSLTPSWMDAHSVHPYLDMRPSSRARATWSGREPPW